MIVRAAANRTHRRQAIHAARIAGRDPRQADGEKDGKEVAHGYRGIYI